jgi:hypothetical protein
VDPSNNASVEPRRDIPHRDTADPNRANDLRDIDAPRATKPNTDTDAATREKLLIDMPEPKLKKSITDRENNEPNLVMPILPGSIRR